MQPCEMLFPQTFIRNIRRLANINSETLLCLRVVPYQVRTQLLLLILFLLHQLSKPMFCINSIQIQFNTKFRAVNPLFGIPSGRDGTKMHPWSANEMIHPICRFRLCTFHQALLFQHIVFKGSPKLELQCRGFRQFILDGNLLHCFRPVVGLADDIKAGGRNWVPDFIKLNF